MSQQRPRGANDLVVLVADANMEASVRALLSRSPSLGIGRVDPQIFRHPGRDPGVFGEAHKFLAPYCQDYGFALAMFDLEGCGQEGKSAQQMEEEVKGRLEQAGWKQRCDSVVIDPELEVWVWSDSPHVPQALRLSAKDLGCLLSKHRRCGESKPTRPKEAMEEALRMSGRPRSSAVYEELAQRVSLRHCTDASFLRFTEILRRWFPAGTSGTAARRPRRQR